MIDTSQPVIQKSDRLARGMEYLVTTVQELSLARDLDTIMRIVRTVARKLTGADGATFVLRDNGLCFYADEDAISPLWKGSRFPMGICISGWAMLNKEAALIEDIYADDRIPHEAYRPTFVKSLAMVPIRTMDPIGAIGNYWATQHKPDEEEVILLRSLADITAVAMENVFVYNELENLVKERTAQLEAANKRLEAFSYSVSHDLKNPIHAINGFASLLSESYGDRLDEDGRQMAGLIVTSAQQMDALIGDMLSFFMAEKKELQKEKVPMQALVSEICDKQQMQHPGKNIVFTIAELPDAFADASLLRQVWTNLISNAVKYSGKREQIQVEIGYEVREDQVVYYVKDNGAGFDMSQYSKLFGEFQRLHSQADFEGTGVGLSIVQKIVNRHGGDIRAESAIDKGATFWFSLPQQQS